ncbi:MAG: hypothetical protein CMM47_05235 [Rhodospirillaceae bacterium]|nr:hypothetical protein [Rhodospirillaceae bacterium]
MGGKNFGNPIGLVIRFRGLWIAGMLVLGGCTGLHTDSGSQSASAHAGTSNSSSQRDNGRVDNLPSDPAEVHVVSPFTGAERDPQRLLRMGGGKVTSILGTPKFVRREASARVWQYRTVSCVLNLYFYNEADGLRVVYYQFHSTEGAPVSSGACFESLLLGRGDGSVKS